MTQEIIISSRAVITKTTTLQVQYIYVNKARELVMKDHPVVQSLLLLLLLLVGVVLPTEATKESGSSANTTLQAQPGKHHVQKVSHTEGLHIHRLINQHLVQDLK